MVAGNGRGLPASGTGSYQIDLWMVAATIIGVSLPVFVVIVQFAESASDEVVVLPIAKSSAANQGSILQFSGPELLSCIADSMQFG